MEIKKFYRVTRRTNKITFTDYYSDLKTALEEIDYSYISHSNILIVEKIILDGRTMEFEELLFEYTPLLETYQNCFNRRKFHTYKWKINNYEELKKEIAYMLDYFFIDEVKGTIKTEAEYFYDLIGTLIHPTKKILTFSEEEIEKAKKDDSLWIDDNYKDEYEYYIILENIRELC